MLRSFLTNHDEISISVPKGTPFDVKAVWLFKDGKPFKRLSHISSHDDVVVFKISESIALGFAYEVGAKDGDRCVLDVSKATEFKGFDETYYYDGQLGSKYGKKATEFTVWAPLSSSVNLRIKRNGNGFFDVLPMKRGEHGEYTLKVDGDLAGALYLYEVTNSGKTMCVTDPYAKGSTLNGKESVVVDFGSLKSDFHKADLPIMNNPTDAIVYECHVRDMTIGPDTDIESKGTFRGLSEPGRKTKDGYPAGLDYIQSLGVTHVQLLPIMDYKTVDEEHPGTTYNWGYDPAQYFVPEGSFGSDINDPLSRIRDLKAMVAAFHSKGIRVVMDVVFNHVYKYEESVFESIVPNYWFRKERNGEMANHSWCGNDLWTERPMVRKLIVDACRHYIDEFGIDGLRFDLMGLLDIGLINAIKEIGLSKDPAFLVYGEGWDMGSPLKGPYATISNHSLLKGVSFFNDEFRENVKSFAFGDYAKLNDMKRALFGYGSDSHGVAKFSDASQSINYVECHDNLTLYDDISKRLPNAKEEEKLQMCALATSLCLLSFGIPFIHSGQEIGQSKGGDGNTYNKGDAVNMFRYDLLPLRKEMLEKAKEAIEWRKKHSFLHVYDARVMKQLVVTDERNGLFAAEYREKNIIGPLGTLDLIVNPYNECRRVDFDHERIALLGECIDHGKTVFDLKPWSFCLFGK